MNPRHEPALEIHTAVVRLRERASELFLGLSARHMEGPFKGRWGRVSAVALDDRHGIMLMVQPYRARIVSEHGLPTGIVDEEHLISSSHAAVQYRPPHAYGWLDDYAPCRACGRRVASPCHDVDSFHENGPWGGSCRDVFFPERGE